MTSARTLAPLRHGPLRCGPLRYGAVAGLAGLLLSGCGGGGSSLFNGGDQGPSNPDFIVQTVLPLNGQVWQVNRPIEVTFNATVNPSSVSAASISIRETVSGEPALGTYSIKNGKVVVFQPACPTSTSPSGLKPGGVQYVISIASSSDPGATTVISSGGDALTGGLSVNFTTPASGSPMFYDPKVNQPPKVAAATFTSTNADGTSQESAFGLGAVIPPNKFVGPSVSFTLTFDQPLDPSPVNISASNVQLQFEKTPGVYSQIPTSVDLIANCTEVGAKVRVVPLGLLPSGRKVRFAIQQAFSDIAGETSPFVQNVPTSTVAEPTIEAAGNPDFDAILEEFATTADQDPSPGFTEPAADWAQDGTLAAGFAFGGIPTDFELIVENGQDVLIDTSTATLQVKDGLGNPSTATFVNGKIFLRKLTVKSGGKIRGQGPNSLRFFVNETVKVEGATGGATPLPAGTIAVEGADALNVATLLTASVFSQKGGVGVCGGGNGGLGNPVTSQSCVKGGNGFGSFQAIGIGGEGGESSLVGNATGGAPCFEVEDRHPGGGGGGTYSTLGEKANDGTAAIPYTGVGGCVVGQGVSAVNPATFPLGGKPGISPFLNTTPADNFIGATIQVAGTASSTGSTTTKIKTTTPIFVSSDADTRYVAVYRKAGTWEDSLSACAPPSPGAQNVNAADPTICFRSTLQIRKIDPNNLPLTGVLDSSTVTVNPALPVAPATGDTVVVLGRGETTIGELPTAAGGQGGGGGGNAIGSQTITNPSFGSLDKVGAGGGGGGGILEIQTLGLVQMGGLIDAGGGNGAAGENTIFLDRLGGGSGGGSGGSVFVQSATKIETFIGTATGRILARGGRRGGGAFEVQADPIPPTIPQGIGHGGRGGKGLVQLQSPIDPTTGKFQVTFLPVSPQPASTDFDPQPLLLLPSFGAKTRARSKWFDTGVPLAAGMPIYQFGGVSLPSTPGLGPIGNVVTDSSGFIDTSTPIVALGSVPVGAVTANSVTMLQADLQQVGNQKAAEPRTMIGDAIKIDANVGSIVSVTESGPNVTLTTDNGSLLNPTPLNAGLPISGSASWQLIARYFAITTLTSSGAVADFVPPAPSGFSTLSIQFQGADADSLGNPDASSIVPSPSSPGVLAFGTSDMSVVAGKRFLRFTVSFDLAPNGATPTPSAPRPLLKFLKVPFQFN